VQRISAMIVGNGHAQEIADAVAAQFEYYTWVALERASLEGVVSMVMSCEAVTDEKRKLSIGTQLYDDLQRQRAAASGASGTAQVAAVRQSPMPTAMVAPLRQSPLPTAMVRVPRQAPLALEGRMSSAPQRDRRIAVSGARRVAHPLQQVRLRLLLKAWDFEVRGQLGVRRWVSSLATFKGFRGWVRRISSRCVQGHIICKAHEKPQLDAFIADMTTHCYPRLHATDIYDTNEEEDVLAMMQPFLCHKVPGSVRESLSSVSRCTPDPDEERDEQGNLILKCEGSVSSQDRLV